MKKKYRKLFAGFLFMLLFLVGAVSVQAGTKVKVQIEGTCDYENAAEAFMELNSRRLEEGKEAIVMDKKLQAAAMQRAAEIAVLFSHTRPNNQSWTTALPKIEGDPGFGENIAAFYETGEEAIIAWMESNENRANILYGGYEAVGVGCFDHWGQKTWAVVFSEKGTAFSPSAKPKKVTATVEADINNLDTYIIGASEEGDDYLEAGQPGVLMAVNVNAEYPSLGVVLKGNGSGIRWSVSNPSVFSIIEVMNEGCVVDAKKGGSATVTLTYNGVTLARDEVKVKGITAPSKPKIKEVKPVSGKKIKITWTPVSNAQGYRLYRKTPGGNWVNVKTLSSKTSSYTDASVKAGVTYTYTVRAYRKAYGETFWSSYEAGKSATPLTAAPSLKSIKSASNRVQITWGKVSDAAGYGVFRKIPGGGWQKVKEVSSSASSYIDGTGKPGTTYIYSVRAYSRYSGKKLWGEYNSKGLTITIRFPVVKDLKVVTASTGYNQVKWSKMPGVDGYRIYRKTASTGWKELKDVGPSVTSYTDKSVKPTQSYIYNIRAICKVNHKYVLGDYEKKGVTSPIAFGKVKLGKTSVSDNKRITVRWEKLSGVSGYRIYRKTAVSGWKGLKDVKASVTSFMDGGAEPGVVYTYTVRGYKKTGSKVIWSGYDSKGVSTYLKLGTVKLGKASAAEGRVTVRWNRISGVDGYCVFRKTATSGWKTVAKVSASGAYGVDKKAEKGKTYYYTVRGYKKTGSQVVWSGYNTKGIKVKVK